MVMTPEFFEAQGFAQVPQVLTAQDCVAIAARMQASAALEGARCLLDDDWCAELAQRLRRHPCIAQLVPAQYLAVQCTGFEKSASRNWLVAVHQDLSIPVAARVNSPSLRGWSEKQGRLFVQAPPEVLAQLVAVRVHLDACMASDGPLRVVPGSHNEGIFTPEAAALARNKAQEVACHAERGDALVMRPLLLHASSKATGFSRRRILHFVFGPRALPHALRWHQVV